ncbi:MAG: TolB family protein, partial [Candidatus Acidiferrales bacterium]
MSKLRPFLIVVGILLASGLATNTSAQETFTLEQVMSAPFPSELTAAPAGGKVAWVLNARGVRNIWVAEPPDYRGRQLTSYTEDDGQEISDLKWTPDASAIIFVRGGDSNRHGEYPNPTSDAGGAEQDVWVISLEGGAPRKLGEGHSPAVSPRGGVAFLRKDLVWWAPLDAEAKAEQLI